MATKTLYVEGTAMWVKAKTPDPEYGHFSMDLYPNKKGLKIIQDAKLEIEPRIKDDKTFYKLRRPDTKMIKDELVKFGPPKVVLNTGKVDDKGIPITEPFDGLVGNGSEVTVKISAYTAGKFNGHRLEAIRIDKLIEYKPDRSAVADKPATEEYPF